MLSRKLGSVPTPDPPGGPSEHRPGSGVPTAPPLQRLSHCRPVDALGIPFWVQRNKNRILNRLGAPRLPSRKLGSVPPWGAPWGAPWRLASYVRTGWRSRHPVCQNSETLLSNASFRPSRAFCPATSGGGAPACRGSRRRSRRPGSPGGDGGANMAPKKCTEHGRRKRHRTATTRFFAFRKT